MPGHGLGLGARGHARLAILYGLALVTVAGFGAGRLRETFPEAVAAISAYRHNVAAYFATRAAFLEAMRTNAARPRPNPAIPHRIDFYPVLAERRHQEGDVLVRVLVLPSGQVGDAAIVRSSGFSQLDAAALVGVGGWYYVPAARDHRPVAAWTMVDVRFRVPMDPAPPAARP